MNDQSGLPPGIGKPALRALRSAGIENLGQLEAVTEKELLKLHGFGPRALRIIREALAAEGRSFKNDDT